MPCRVYHLGAESLWYDETVSAYLSSRSPLEIIRHTAGDIHPPGYYLMLYGWRAAVRPTLNDGLEYLLGWSSVAWGMLVVALLYPLGRRLLDRRSALIAVWLAAINPFHLWYSQEVRMYTMGAALGLAGLWMALKWLDSPSRRWRYLLAYALLAAIGLYTLYYFALLLIAINGIVFALLLTGFRQSSSDSDSGHPLFAWMIAQVAVLLLYLPWGPTLWRQATDPPVPPWRVPWQNIGEFSVTVSESLSALTVGQTPPAEATWPWALLTLAATAIFLVLPLSDDGSVPSTSERDRKRRSYGARITLLTYVFLPIMILYLLTLTLTPVYHVRYLFVYAPPFMLILAASVSALWAKRVWLGIGWLVLIGGISLASLQQFWFNPLYRADDHRGAVAELAENWRPGDVILANAGWSYTAIDTYWPQEIDGSYDSIPPALAAIQRFNQMPDPPPTDQPIVAVTGSVDGDASLGWGDPESDFFVVSEQETMAALDNLAETYDRIWHYRIYDTVNDPDAKIRNRLEENGALRWENAYPGRDYLRVQLYENEAAPESFTEESFAEESFVAMDVDFGGFLRLDRADAPQAAHAGENLYVNLAWSPLPSLRDLDTDLSVSLRLYDSDGNLLIQNDGPPLLPTTEWTAEKTVQQPIYLPLPAGTRPEPYSLELVVYRQDNGLPLQLPDDSRSIHGQRLLLGQIDLLPAQTRPSIGDVVARYDYIDLVEAHVDRTTAAPGEEIRVDLVWRPRTSDYTDNYLATLELRNQNNTVVGSWTAPLAGTGYPSSEWPAELPVIDTRILQLADATPPGDYKLDLKVERSSDGLPIKAGRGRVPIHNDYTTVANVTVE